MGMLVGARSLWDRDQVVNEDSLTVYAKDRDG